jgi:membrane associated rhomboid family serine protease
MATCYRHPDRETNVACSNCGRPICPDCMTSTPVGMRCPECARQRTRVHRGAGGLRAGAAPATYVLIGINVAAFLAEIATGSGGISGGGSLVRDGGVFGPAIDGGEWWRIVTGGFLHSGLLHLGLNVFAVWILGNLLEPAIGTPRFLGVYFVSLLAGSFGALLLDPNQNTIGASGAIFGLMAASFIIAHRRGMGTLSREIGLFVVLNLVFTVTVPGISIGGHLGGLVGGALAGLLLAFSERRPPRERVAIDLLGLLALAAISVAGALWAAGQAGI